MDVNVKLVKKLIDYIEHTEELIDGEWGHCRSFDELLRDGEVPSIYFELKMILEE
ncbi:hypothetical protein [Rossellomorea marisflavi]|uniref:hypothetical protein n=1 Tax=Rossellomorea marisflavi TaxID=189381 RepID=UPI003F9EF717